MTAWNVETFFEKFANGTLGRKTQYSTYWVMKFDGCTVLCNRSGRSEHVCGIYMGPELCIFNKGVCTNPQYSMSIDDSEDVTESGLIDLEKTAGNGTAISALFQVGHSQYLLEPYWSWNKIQTYEEIMNSPYDKNVDIMQGAKTHQKYGVYSNSSFIRAIIKKMPPGRFHSVKEAREALIPAEVAADPEGSFILKEWWFTPVPDYVPKDLSPEEKLILERPPMPWHYGLTTQIVKPILDSLGTIETAISQRAVQIHMNPEVYSQLTKYVQSKIRYGKIIEKMNELYINQDDESSDFRSFFLLPGQSMAYVQKANDDKYFVMGDLRSKNGEHFSLRYHGMEKAYGYPTLKFLKSWHVMNRGWNRG